MKKTGLAALSWPLIFLVSLSQVFAEEPRNTSEILVRFKDGESTGRRDQVHLKVGGHRLKRIGREGLERVAVPVGMSADAAAALYEGEQNVLYAEPNRKLELHETIPSDPLFPNQWSLQNTGQLGGVPGADIKATSAWDYTIGSPDAVIATIDTGVDYNHPDLAANIWTNPWEIPGNGIDDDGNGYVDDVHGVNVNSTFRTGDPMDVHVNGHGTHVAGIIGAVGGNGTGVTGVNWEVKIMACRAFDSQGGGTDADVIECLDYIRAMKARGVNIVAVNNSWGRMDATFPRSLHDAFRSFNDILLVASAGNGADNGLGLQKNYPSSFDLPHVLSVASTDYSDSLYSGSNYGPSVHLAAPGAAIQSTTLTTSIWAKSYGIYRYLTGTSQAAPHVTALAGLIFDVLPDAGWSDIRNLILTGAEEMPSLSDKTVYGRRINALGTVACTDSAILKPLRYPVNNLATGAPVLLSALSIRCASAVGPVTVDTGGGEVVDLRDDGIYPDQAAGDGIFAAEWTPNAPFGQLVFSSPLGVSSIPLLYPVVLTPTALPAAGSALFYRVMLEAQGGEAPYTWSISEGVLPDGLSLDPSTGEIAGVVSGPCASFTVAVVDQKLNTSQARMVIHVDPLTVSESIFNRKTKKLRVVARTCGCLAEPPLVLNFGSMVASVPANTWLFEASARLDVLPATITVVSGDDQVTSAVAIQRR